MPESISLGPLQLQWSMLGVFLAALAGYAAVSWRLRKEERRISISAGRTEQLDAGGEQASLRSALTNILANGLIVVLLAWKFGFLLKTPSIIWEQPLGLLIYWSSADMVVLGVVAAFVVVLVQLRKAEIPAQTAADAAAFGVLTAYAVRQVVLWPGGRETEWPWAIPSESAIGGVHPLGAYALVFSAVLGLWLWNRKEPLGSGGYVRDLCVFGGIGLLGLSLFKEPPKETVFLLTAEQWGFATLAILGSSVVRLFGLIQFSDSRHTMASGTNNQTDRQPIAKEHDMMAANDSEAQIRQAQQNEDKQRQANTAMQTEAAQNNAVQNGTAMQSGVTQNTAMQTGAMQSDAEAGALSSGTGQADAMQSDTAQADKKLNGPNRPSI